MNSDSMELNWTLRPWFLGALDSFMKVPFSPIQNLKVIKKYFGCYVRLKGLAPRKLCLFFPFLIFIVVFVFSFFSFFCLLCFFSGFLLFHFTFSFSFVYTINRLKIFGYSWHILKNRENKNKKQKSDKNNKNESSGANTSESFLFFLRLIQLLNNIWL